MTRIWFSLRKRTPRARPADVLQAAQAIGRLLGSGLAIAAALDVAIELGLSDSVAQSLRRQAEAVRGGQRWSDALKHDSLRWPHALTAWIEVGETTGNMAVCIDQYRQTCEQRNAHGHALRGALIYPLLVWTVALGAAVFMHFTFSDLLADLPAAPATTVWWADEDNLLIGSPVALIALLGWRRQRKSAAPRHCLEVPWWSAGGLFSIADTLQSLAFLLACGIPLLHTLRQVRTEFAYVWHATPWMKAQLAGFEADLERGHSLARTLQRLNWPPSARSLALIAEQTGDLSTLFAQLAEIYYQKAYLRQQRILRWSAPLALGGAALLLVGSYLRYIWPMYAGMNELAP
jgi:type IV pilus assembly protein PilC